MLYIVDLNDHNIAANMVVDIYQIMIIDIHISSLVFIHSWTTKTILDSYDSYWYLISWNKLDNWQKIVDQFQKVLEIFTYKNTWRVVPEVLVIFEMKISHCLKARQYDVKQPFEISRCANGLYFRRIRFINDTKLFLKRDNVFKQGKDIP